MSSSLLSLTETSLAPVPASLRPAVKQRWQELAPPLAGLPPGDWLTSAPRVLAASDFVARSGVAQPAMLRELVASGDLARAYATGELLKRVAGSFGDVSDEATLKVRLRHLRRREMVRIAWRDLAGSADLHEAMATLSELADACVDQALEKLHAWACAKYGEPKGAHSREPQRLVVLALGKLGGRELNFSSDIDLMFAYPEEGETHGARALSNHEFFVRLGQALINALNESTADGFVFRVDMRLRPNGASGPLALSFDAMEHYYQTHGREWERYALIKARVIADGRAAGAELMARLKPFVFRKYLDFGTIEAIRAMKAMIAREVSRKGLESNIKLGPGGIREIEFLAQALQLIRGGREPGLAEPMLLKVLPRLATGGHITPEAERELAAAYAFLRNTEHRLQMVDDRQTQELPSDEKEKIRLAFASGFDGWPAFEHALNRHRRRVQELFSQVFTAPQGEAAPEAKDGLHGVWLGAVEPAAAQQILREAGYADPSAALALLDGLRAGGAYESFSAEGRARMDRLVPLLIAAAGLSADPLTTLARLVNLLEAIGRRSTYLALLIENPMALSQLVKLLSASPWIASWLAQHPILLDELLDPRSLYEPLEQAALADELRQRLAHIPAEDFELQMEILREFRHGNVLRVAAADVSGGLAPEQTGTYLAAIAEVVIEESLELAQRTLTEKHGEPRCPGMETPPGFAVIGYGKLGSRELGYGSDLDMIFIYEGCDVQGRTGVAEDKGLIFGSGTLGATEEGMTRGPRPLPNEAFFARLGQRLIHILTTRTPGGILYEVDMRLRPSGKSGPLVTSLTAFRDYQRDHAWTWEHQALVRARPVAGDAGLARAFAQVRREILCLPRDPAKLKADVREMRAKMAAEKVNHDATQVDVKHDPGGIVDIEFMVQYGVLRWAHEHPGLTRHTDNIHILEALKAEGLLEPERARLLTEAYRRYLSVEHRLKLMERGSLANPAELGDWPAKVRRIWDEVFNE